MTQEHKHYIGAFDPGYGGGKVALVGPRGNLLTGIVPAVVGMGKTDLGLLSLGDVGRHRRRRLPDAVVFDDITYLVGHNVERYAEPMKGMDFQRLRGGAEIRALFYDVVYQVLGPGHYTLSLLIGLPVEVMVEKQRAVATLRSLNQWMVGEHCYTVNDDEMIVDVQAVELMAQPIGALFAWGMDNQGRWTRGRDALRASVGVLDIGFNTLDLFAIEGIEVAKRYTDGDTLGMRRAAEHLIQMVDDAYDKEISLHQADALIRDGSPTFSTPQGEVDLQPMVDQALSRAASGILSFVQKPDKWGSGRQFDHLLVTGGGAEALRSQLHEAFPRAHIMANPVVANAIGLARNAQQVFE